MKFTVWKESIKIVINKSYHGAMMGSIEVENYKIGNIKVIKLQNVLFFPDIAHNRISIFESRKNGDRATVDTHGNDPKNGRVKLLDKITNNSKMVGEEVSGQYHGARRVCKDISNVRTESRKRL